MGLPADASGAYRPNPQATTKLAPRPSSLKGYLSALFEVKQLDFLRNRHLSLNSIFAAGPEPLPYPPEEEKKTQGTPRQPGG